MRRGLSVEYSNLKRLTLIENGNHIVGMISSHR